MFGGYLAKGGVIGPPHSVGGASGHTKSKGKG